MRCAKKYPIALNLFATMIHLRLSGGLGNQLYQLAATALLAQRRQCRAKIHLEGLGRYDVPRSPDSLKLIGENEWLEISTASQRTIPQWMSVTARFGRIAPLYGVNDGNFWTTMAQEQFKNSRYLFLDGYFQHGWTQKSFSNAVALMSIAPISTATRSRIAQNEVSIHIRGGDFLSIPRFQVVDSTFYVECIRQATSRGFESFAVITDDRKYAEKVCDEIVRIFPKISLRTLDQSACALEDFDILRFSSARIIGNSTFAWWAAALDSKRSVTWSPSRFTKDRSRDFFLDHENVISTYSD